MIYQSTTAASIGHSGNRDPEPYVGNNSGRRYGAIHPGGVHYAPRPEFDRPPVNPILANFRGDAEIIGTAEAVSEYLAEAEGAFDNSWADDFTPAEVEHARRVLTLLVTMSA